MLKVENLTIDAGDKRIIDGISFEVPEGEIHVIMGPNGVGKSTICKAIMASPEYDISGKIEYNGEDITKLSTEERSKRGLFLLFQNPIAIPGVTNAEMLRSALMGRGINASIFEFNKIVTDACNKIGLDKSFVHRAINENMSGGEKKKNELLSIEVLKPSFLLLDELDSGLDVDSLKTLGNELANYQKELNAGMLIITHHTNILEYLHPDKIYILSEGHIVQEGDASLASKIEKEGFKGAFSVSE